MNDVCDECKSEFACVQMKTTIETGHLECFKICLNQAMNRHYGYSPYYDEDKYLYDIILYEREEFYNIINKKIISPHDVINIYKDNIRNYRDNTFAEKVFIENLPKVLNTIKNYDIRGICKILTKIGIKKEYISEKDYGTFNLFVREFLHF